MPESPLSPTAASETPVSSLLSHTDSGAGERAVNGDSCSGVSVANWHQNSHQKQVFLAMMAPQQMHHLLFPSQLQALIQQKQQALMLQQQHLKESYKKQRQIQMQLGQQLSNTENEELAAQQLMFQQLFQLQQQQFLQVHRPVLSSPALSSDGLSPAKMQQLWKELTKGIAEDKAISKGNQDSSTDDAMSTQARGRQPGDQQTSSEKAECAVKADHAARNVLYSHGMCNWPGCELVCDNINQFIKHIVSDHTLDDRSTAQCRVQMQVVQQLELQLCKERERLRAMTAHLHLPSSEAQSLQSDAGPDPSGPQLSSVAVATNNQSSLGPSDSASPQPRACVRSPSQGCPKDSPLQTSCARAIRRCHNPLVYSLSSENEYQLYKNTDIRPPFTYATLIRQAIMETSDRQLTLNQIYNWFTQTFAYFRRNAATWKNAVRHNLSLHKCFVRVENVKGAVWTVDELEFQRRRSQRIAGSTSLMKNVSSNLDFGNFLNAGLQESLPGANKECVGRDPKTHRKETKPANIYSQQNISPQIQQPLFHEDAAAVSGREPLTSVVKPATQQQDTLEYDDHLFDFA